MYKLTTGYGWVGLIFEKKTFLFLVETPKINRVPNLKFSASSLEFSEPNNFLLFILLTKWIVYFKYKFPF